jgi:hypothetical protein
MPPFQSQRTGGMLADDGNAFTCFFKIHTVFDALDSEIYVSTFDWFNYGHFALLNAKSQQLNTKFQIISTIAEIDCYLTPSQGGTKEE